MSTIMLAVSSDQTLCSNDVEVMYRREILCESTKVGIVRRRRGKYLNVGILLPS